VTIAPIHCTDHLARIWANSDLNAECFATDRAVRGPRSRSQGIIKPIARTNQAYLKVIRWRLRHPSHSSSSGFRGDYNAQTGVGLGAASGGRCNCICPRDAVNADDVKWGPVPTAFPAGAQIAVISGDPFKEGLYVVRLKMPTNYKIPAHNHPTSEYVTVLSGDFHIGMGDKLDAQKGQLLRAGGFAAAPAKMNHYAWCSGETVVQVHGQGPFAITYVDPADDPSKK
jgi:quercetin dioxygenase-like cupin family protein